MKGLTHAERRVLRRQALADIAAGADIAEVARRTGYSPAYLRSASYRTTGPVLTAKRRRARVVELVSLGCTMGQIATLLRAPYYTIVSDCRIERLDPVRSTAGWEPVVAKARAKAEVMAALYRDGFTLKQIGQQYGVTRERVRQLLSKHKRMSAADGGLHVRAARQAEKREAARNEKCFKKWGCSRAQYLELRAMKKPTRAFSHQHKNALRRGIGWELTLWQWWTLWQASGHWHERGRGQGYVMCRKNDTGPYAVGNVYFATGVQNSSDGQRKKRKDPSLPIGVSRTESGRYHAQRHFGGKLLRLGTHDTPELAYAAYLRAGQADLRAAA